MSPSSAVKLDTMECDCSHSFAESPMVQVPSWRMELWQAMYSSVGFTCSRVLTDNDMTIVAVNTDVAGPKKMTLGVASWREMDSRFPSFGI